MDGQHIVLPCGSNRTASSLALQWSGVVVEQHTAFAEPAQLSTFPYFLLEVAAGTRVATGERAVPRVGFRRYRKVPGMVNFYTEGVRPALRPTTTTELVVCAFDRDRIAEIAAELSCKSSPRPLFGLIDTSISRLAVLLAEEAKQGNPCGRLYAESLVQALMARLLFSQGTRAHTRVGATPAGINRVIDLMHAYPSRDFSLNELAVESGFSRSHFLRLFQQATASTPHTYLLGLRVELAKTLLSHDVYPLTDVALQAGFKNLSDFSRTFRQRTGTPPSAFRRSMRGSVKNGTIC